MGRRYSEARIQSILREAALGTPVMDLCWNHCISRSTLRAWKAKYGAAHLRPAASARQPDDTGHHEQDWKHDDRRDRVEQRGLSERVRISPVADLRERELAQQ